MLLSCSLCAAKCELGKGKFRKKSTSDTRRFLLTTVERFHFVLPCVSARVSLRCCSAKYNRDHPLNVAFFTLGTVSGFLRLSTGRTFSDGFGEIIIQKANLYTPDMPKKTYLCMCNHINRSFCGKKITCDISKFSSRMVKKWCLGALGRERPQPACPSASRPSCWQPALP